MFKAEMVILFTILIFSMLVFSPTSLADSNEFRLTWDERRVSDGSTTSITIHRINHDTIETKSENNLTLYSLYETLKYCQINENKTDCTNGICKITDYRNQDITCYTRELNKIEDDDSIVFLEYYEKGENKTYYKIYEKSNKLIVETCLESHWILNTIFNGIIIGASGGALAGLFIWMLNLIRDKKIESKDKKKIYDWLYKETKNKGTKKWRSTRAIASYNNLTKDRVRYICSIHEKIISSTGKEEDIWGIEKFVRSQ